MERQVKTLAGQKEHISRRSQEISGYQAILKKNLMGPITPRTQVSGGSSLPPISKMPLKLIGTFISGTDYPSAIIEDQKKNVQDAFMLNDTIFGSATLTAIFPDRVEIKRDNQTEILKLDDTLDSGSTAGGGNVIAVSAADLDQALANLPLLLTQARAVPYFQNGKSVGLRMFAIKQGSLFEKIGLKNGDILKSVNGNNLGDITQAVKIFEKLKEEKNLSLSLERDRNEQEMRYQIQ